MNAVGERTRGIDYQPALDGVRAVAVVLVLLFHQGFSWMTGGYVGVSVFFTLSGYLITSLLVVEHRRDGRISFAGFYSRRVKRLMPASLLCLCAVALLAAAGEFAQATELRGDIVAAALQVFNWRVLFQDTSYAQLIQGGAGPVDHFWSLAVEEQFYWMWPLLFAGVFALWRSPRARSTAVVALAAVAVAAGPFIAWRWGPDAAYWATPARLGEILVGAALAVVLDRRAQQGRSVPRRAAKLAWPAMALIVWAAVALPSGRGLAYGGWLGVGSLVTAALILGLQASGSLRHLLSASPVVALGRISYGVYLFHWPVYLLVDAGNGWGQFALRVTITLAIAALSFALIERPVRERALPRRALASLAAAGTAGVVVLALLNVPAPTTSFGAGAELEAQVTFSPTSAPLGDLRPAVPTSALPSTAPPVSDNEIVTAPTLAATTVLPVPVRPVRILVLGDSTGQALSNGLVHWAADHPELAQVEVLARPGCGLIGGGSTMVGDESHKFQSACDDAVGRQLSSALTDRTPDLVVVLVTLPDAVERTWPGEQPVSPTDPLFASRLDADYRAVADRLLAVPTVRVAWLTAAPPATWFLGYYANIGPIADFDAESATIEQLAHEHPDRILRVDFGSWLVSQEATEVDGVDARFWRPDGLHLDPAAALTVVDDYLWPQLVTFAVQ